MRLASMRITGCGANRGMHRTNYDTVASMSAGVYASLAIWAGGTMTNLSGEASRRRRGHRYALLALVTCPCHLPILALLLSGSAMGAFLNDYFITALIIFSLFFVCSLAATFRAFRVKHSRNL